MNNSKEKDIVLYELSDNLGYKVCLKITPNPPIQIENAKLDSVKSWEGKKNSAVKNRSIECTFDENLKYNLKFKVVSTPTVSNTYNLDYQEQNLSIPLHKNRVVLNSFSGKNNRIDSIVENPIENKTSKASLDKNAKHIVKSRRGAILTAIFVLILGVYLSVIRVSSDPQFIAALLFSVDNIFFELRTFIIIPIFILSLIGIILLLRKVISERNKVIIVPISIAYAVGFALLGLSLISFLETGIFNFINPLELSIGLGIVILFGAYIISSFFEIKRNYRPLIKKKKSKNRYKKEIWLIIRLVIIPVLFSAYFYFLYYIPFVENTITYRISVYR